MKLSASEAAKGLSTVDEDSDNVKSGEIQLATYVDRGFVLTCHFRLSFARFIFLHQSQPFHQNINTLYHISLAVPHSINSKGRAQNSAHTRMIFIAGCYQRALSLNSIKSPDRKTPRRHPLSYRKRLVLISALIKWVISLNIPLGQSVTFAVSV